MSGKVTPLPGITPRGQAPELQVVSWETSTLWSGAAGRLPRYNPDELIGRRGYKIYAQMILDEQVKAVVQFKRDAILSPGWELQYPAHSALDKAEQDARCNVVCEIFDRMRGSFHDSLAAIASGRVFGYSLTEKVYETIQVDGKPVAGLNSLLPRPVDTFLFYPDEYGTLVRTEQRVNGQLIDIDLSKFVHYVHDPAEDRFYGQSDLRSAYRAWYSKDVVSKLYLSYLERFAGGFAAITQTDLSQMQPGSPDYVALQHIIGNMRSAMGAILPKGVELAITQPGATSEFRDALTMFDLQIAKALLVPNLLGVSHTGQTGAFSQSQTQLDAFFWTLRADSARLESCINEQLIKDLGDRNWGDQKYPQFCFKPPSQETVKWIVDKWTALVTAKAVKSSDDDEAHIRDMLEFPPAADPDEEPSDEPTDLTADDTKIVTDICAQVSSGAIPADSAKAILAHATDLSEEEIAAIIDPIEVKKPDPIVLPDGRVVDPANPATHTPIGQQKNSPPPGDGAASTSSVADTTSKPSSVGGEPSDTSKRAAFSRASNRVDFAVLAQRANVVSESAVPQLARLLARAVRRQLSADRLPELLDQNVDDIGALALDGSDVGKIKAGFKDALQRAWSVGTEAARREMAKATQANASMTAIFRAPVNTLRDQAAGYFEANGFRMAANLTDGARSIIQQELLQSVKAGTRPDEAAAGIYDRLIRKGFTTLDALQLEEPREDILTMVEGLLSDALDVQNVPAYLNTLVRTNTFEALNEARFAEFTDPALEDFVQALQYSAIMDDRTTEICASLDQHIYAADSDVWNDYRPPNHYNCRSVLIPITQADGWDGNESDPPTVEPQDGFGGSP